MFCQKSEQCLIEKKPCNESIVNLINKLKQKLKARMAEKLKPFDMTTEQRAILLVLSEKGAITQKQICEFIGAEPSNMSITLKRLISKGLIQKIDHPTDTRAYLVDVTDESKKLIDTLYLLREDIIKALTKDIEVSDLQTTIKTLQKMNANLD